MFKRSFNWYLPCADMIKQCLHTRVRMKHITCIRLLYMARCLSFLTFMSERSFLHWRDCHVALSNVLSVDSRDGSLRSREVRPPFWVRCLVTSRSMPWVKEVRGRAVLGGERGRDRRQLWCHYLTVTRTLELLHTGWHTPNTLLFFAWLDESDPGLREGKYLWFFFSSACTCEDRGGYLMFVFDVYIGSNTLTCLMCFCITLTVCAWCAWEEKPVYFCWISSMTRSCVNIFPVTFSKMIYNLHIMYRFGVFVIHLPAVATVYVSMPVYSLHMLSRRTAISGRWTLSHLVAVPSYDMEKETLEPSPWAWRKAVCLLQILCFQFHR